MFGALPYKTKQFFFLLIKISIVVGAIYFIYQKLTTNEHLEFDTFIQFLSDHNVFSLQNIAILLVLTVLNWCFEILKWKSLTSVIKTISFKDAAKQTLAALTASLMTPNRVGDYGFKTFYFKKTLAKKVMLLNLLGNLAQMSITVIFGIVGLYFLVLNYDVDISYKKVARALVMVIIIGGFIVFGLKNIKAFKLDSIINFAKGISKQIHVKNMSFSLIRYLIFSFQFYFLLTAFGVDVTYLNAMIVISSMYLLSSIIPSIFIFDVLVKGSVALFLFGIVGVNDLTILSVVTLMWVLNFVLPSVLGGVYVLEFNTESLFDKNTKD
jgi:hypothetical protein